MVALSRTSSEIYSPCEAEGIGQVCQAHGPFFVLSSYEEPRLVFRQLKIWQAGHLGKVMPLRDPKALQSTKQFLQFAKSLDEVGGGK